MAKTRRPPRVSPDSKEGREIGLDDRDIEGGLAHLPDKPVVKREEPETAEPLAEFRGMMAHGVYADDEKFEFPRDLAKLDKEGPPEYAKPEHLEEPVPVFVVEQPEARKVRRECLFNKLTVTVTGGEPTRLCSVDPDRVHVYLLNADSANDALFSNQIAGVLAGNAGILPHGMTSYLRLSHQGELWAQSANATAVSLYVIQETEVSGG